MKIEMDLTQEEITMIRLSLEDRGDKLFEKRKDEEEQDKYYMLADVFRKLKYGGKANV